MMNNKKKVKILLINNNEMMCVYFRDIFWIHGKNDNYDIKIVSSLDEAEKIIQGEDTRPDTIFLDVLMSSNKKGDLSHQMNYSIEFIDKIKKNFPDIKIIICSEHRDLSIEKAVSKLGVNGYLVKDELMPKEIVHFTDKIHGTNN